MNPLKLTAKDSDELAAISAHLESAQIRIEDIAYIPEIKRFVFAAKRQISESGSFPQTCYSGVHFDRVSSVNLQDIEHKSPQSFLTFIRLFFEEDNATKRKVTFIFKDKKSVHIEIEDIDAFLTDYSIKENY